MKTDFEIKIVEEAFQRITAQIQTALDTLAAEYQNISNTGNTLGNQWIGDSASFFVDAVKNTQIYAYNCSNELVSIKNKIETAKVIIAETDQKSANRIVARPE